MKALFSTLLSLGLLCHFSSYAQSECASFHRKNCGDKEGTPMRYDSQSKSAIMAKGQTSEFHMVAYNGLDYRISVCADELIGTEVQFKIFEKDRVLIGNDEENDSQAGGGNASSEGNYSQDNYSDNSYGSDSYSDSYSSDPYGQQSQSEGSGGEPKFKLVKELLYDNAEDSYSNFIEFTAEGSKSLIIEVTIPGESTGSKLKIKEMGCVGVLIEHTKSRHSGF